MFTLLLKDFLEECLKGELDEHLLNKITEKGRHGKTNKQVKTGLGSLEITTPRDRDSSFEPSIVEKRKSTLGTGLER